jgi:hypothetical protein
MNRRTLRPRAFILSELIGVVTLTTLVLLVLTRLVNDAVYMQRVASDHADRVAVMDTVTTRLNRDLAAASVYHWDGTDTLVLRGTSTSQSTNVSYVFSNDLVRRQVDDRSQEWRTRRLSFAARLAYGPSGDVLELDFIAQPPPRRIESDARTYHATFTLPPAGTGAVWQEQHP